MRNYIVSGRERYLYRAYELGRQALDEEENILDVTGFHAKALVEMLASLEKDLHGKAIADADVFFSEFVSPFEMTFRGFMDAGASLKKQINERNDAKEALLQSEKYFRSLIENGLDIVTILDTQGTVMYMSPSSERVLGYTQTELAGKNLFEFLHPDDVDQALELFAVGKDNPYTSARAEFRFKHKNSEWLIMESISKRVLDSPFVDGLIVINSRDITDRRYLEDFRRKYEFIVNTSKEFMMLVNLERRIEAANDACRVVLAKNKEDIVGKKADQVFESPTLVEMFEANLSICFSGVEVSGEGWFELKEVGKRFLETDFYPYRNNLSTVTHAVVVVRDATERKISEDRIRENERRRAEDLKRYAQLAQRAQEDERRRISRELHDDICQRLTALNLQVSVFEDAAKVNKKTSTRRLKSMKTEINDLISEVRTISYNLRPSALDHFGLVTALRLLCSEFEKLHDIQIQFDTDVAPHKRFDPDVEIALYRIAQEAITNCAKHSKASAAYLRLTETNNELSLCVTDNGTGFKLASKSDKKIISKHFGLINMRERTELLAGKFKLESEPGKGTTVCTIVPLKPKNEDAKDKDPLC